MIASSRQTKKEETETKKQEWEWSLSGFAGTETRGVEFFVWGKERKKENQEIQWKKKKNKHQEEKVEYDQ